MSFIGFVKGQQWGELHPLPPHAACQQQQRAVRGAAAAAAHRKKERHCETQGSMAGLQDFHQGSHCHRKTWINILLGVLQLLLPNIQHGGAQLQGL